MSKPRRVSRPIALSPAETQKFRRFCRALIRAYERGELGDVQHEVHPAIPRGERANYLYFTLAPAINYQRKSEGLWRAALATYEDPETSFVFFPENVVRGRAYYAAALRRHSLASFPERHTDIWFSISSRLHEAYGDDPRNLLDAASYDVAKIKTLVRAERRHFPYLSGPKLLNYWLYMLVSFADAPVTSLSEISIIPDTHVVKATVRLGLIPEGEADPEQVAEAWFQVLEGSELVPMDLHAPLWRWSRAGFPPIPPEP